MGSGEFEKGRPKNYIPEDAIYRIAETFIARKVVERYSCIVTRQEIAKNDFNISPSRYINMGEANEYRPIAKIVGELEMLEVEISDSEKVFKSFIKQLVKRA